MARQHGNPNKCNMCGRHVECNDLRLRDDDGVDAQYWLCDECWEFVVHGKDENDGPEPEICGYCGEQVILGEDRICPECGQCADGW